ncbi:MAG: sodium:proton antiporter [Chromatiales bacterium]|jgi:Kef-type K+ transport system membrane component KefB|nr:cation:proton antiporter [Chromatiales bacterium]PLX54599.1 MAG: sodium:proton antiporter [Chromatiales bacterium]
MERATVNELAGHLNIPMILGVLFLVGLAADLIGRYTFLPRVTLLLLAGLSLGSSGFSILPELFIETWFPTLTTIALAFIGFLLGQQLSSSALREHGLKIVIISVCKVLGAWLAVGLALWLVDAPIVIAALLAGVAPATDPAATYDQVRETAAKGEFAETLLAIVGIDDVWGIVIFVAMLALARLAGAELVSDASILSSLADLGKSIALGAILGAPMAYLTGRVRRGEPTMVEAIGFVLLGAGLAEWFELLPIVTSMAMGITVASLASHHDRPFHAIEGIEWPFLVLFFVLAGASLELNALSSVAGYTILYVVARCAGIYAGTRIGSIFANANSQLKSFLGLALFPQAGVAIGMALFAAQRFPEYGNVVLTVAVASTIILETIGPIIARQAIRAAGTT